MENPRRLMIQHHSPQSPGPCGGFTQQTKPNGSEISGKNGKPNSFDDHADVHGDGYLQLLVTIDTSCGTCRADKFHLLSRIPKCWAQRKGKTINNSWTLAASKKQWNNHHVSDIFVSPHLQTTIENSTYLLTHQMIIMRCYCLSIYLYGHNSATKNIFQEIESWFIMLFHTPTAAIKCKSNVCLINQTINAHSTWTVFKIPLSFHWILVDL